LFKVAAIGINRMTGLRFGWICKPSAKLLLFFELTKEKVKKVHSTINLRRKVVSSLKIALIFC